MRDHRPSSRQRLASSCKARSGRSVPVLPWRVIEAVRKLRVSAFSACCDGASGSCDFARESALRPAVAGSSIRIYRRGSSSGQESRSILLSMAFSILKFAMPAQRYNDIGNYNKYSLFSTQCFSESTGYSMRRGIRGLSYSILSARPAQATLRRGDISALVMALKNSSDSK
jgi:hypothetical protein